MSIKVLFDPIVTAQPDRCSTTVQFITFAKMLLAERQDVFIYWLVPDWLTDDEIGKFYPQDDRIEYLVYPQSKDRTREYLTLNWQLDRVLAFNGSHWDFDVLVTVRTGLVPMMKMIMTSPRGARLHWLKEIWLIDEMPLMQFKSTVAKFDPYVQDLFAVTGYLAADKVWSLGYHEPKAIVEAARQYYAPSQVMALIKKIKPVCSTSFSTFETLPHDRFYKKGGKEKFCISYVGRMEMANRIEEINSLMVKTFAMRGKSTRLLVCTQSRIIKEFDKSVVECIQPNRQEFWRLIKEEMHVMLQMAREGGFVLSTVEALLFGLPVVVIKNDWTVALLGKDYPLYVTGETQAYAICKMFYDDYEGMYAKFEEWLVDVFKPLFTQRFKTDLLYTHLMTEVDRFDKEIGPTFAAKYPAKADSNIPDLILKHFGDRKEVVLFDVLRELDEMGELKDLSKQLNPEDREMRSLTFSSNWNVYRQILKAHHGYVDASTKVGHLKRG